MRLVDFALFGCVRGHCKLRMRVWVGNTFCLVVVGEKYHPQILQRDFVCEKVQDVISRFGQNVPSRV